MTELPTPGTSSARPNDIDDALLARLTPAQAETVGRLAHERDRLSVVAERSAERLRRLQEVCVGLARLLDEREVVPELARQVGRVLPCDGVVIARPDLEAGETVTLLRLVQNAERPRPAAPLGRGVLAEVARTGRPVRVAEYDPERSPLAAADDVVGDAGPAGSVLAVPMLVGIQLVGVIAVHHAHPSAYTAEDEELLLTVGTQAAIALTNARLYAESERERRQSEALADIARAVGESLRLGEVLHLILRHASALLRADGAYVALRQHDYLHVVAGVGGAELLAGMHLPTEGSMTGRVVLDGTSLISNAVATDPHVYRPTQRVSGAEKAVIAPLVTAQGPIGAIAVVNRAAEFTDDDARVLQRLADHVAVAIVNARLFGEVAEATREWAVAFDAIASGLAVVDEDGRVTRCNARAAQIVGATSPADLVGCDLHEAVLQDVPAGGSPVERALAGAGVSRGAVRSVRRSKVFDVVASPHPNGGAVVTFDDVTSYYALAERHRQLVETANDGIVITDPHGRIAFANPAAVAMLGAGSAAQVLGVDAGELVAPEFRGEVRAREARTLAGEPQRYEAELLRLDGERRILAVSTAPLREVGQAAGIVASWRDVTDERRARDAVAESEARYRNLFESATDAIYTLARDGALTSMNRATCDVLGHPRDALLGRPIEPFVDAAELDAAREHFAAALAGEARHYECHVHAGGGRRLLSVTNTPIRHGDRVTGVLGIARDVTEERARAAALERSEARYTRLVESASDAIFTVDAAGRFTSVNKALEVATGRRRAALIGAPFADVLDPRDQDAVRRMFESTMRGVRQRGELRYLHASGEVRTASVLTAPVLDQGRVAGVLAVVRDVTEERRLGEQLLQQEKLAAIGQLVSGVAHELNNPLAGVSAFAQILLGTPGVEGEVREAAETIYQEARRAAKIVGNLLTFARQHQPERTAVDLNQVLLDTVELRRYAIRMAQVELDVALDPGLPLTWADPFQLQQVLLNLITNAEHSLGDWGGERRLALRTARAGQTLLITVADTGVGVPPQDLARIFNPFYTTKAVGQGTGLGLSISDGIVREHGGRIRAESGPGGGAAFIVELPWVDPLEMVPGRTAAVASQGVRE